MKRITITRHTSAESLLAALWGEDVAEMQPDIGGERANGEEVEMSWGAYLGNIRAQLVYGYLEGKTIHFWAHPKATIYQLVEFFAHELGHATKPYDYIGGLKFAQEEMRATEFQEVATMALMFARQAKGGG